MERNYLETSAVVLLLRNLQRIYKALKQRITGTYPDSYFYKINSGFFKITGVYYEYSFLGRLAEGSGEGSHKVLYESLTVRRLMMLYKRLTERIICYLKASKACNLARELKNELYLIKTAGIIMVTVILSNSLFSLLLKREICFFAWGIRGLLLFMGLGISSCNTGWQELKETSVMMRALGKPKNKQSSCDYSD